MILSSGTLLTCGHSKHWLGVTWSQKFDGGYVHHGFLKAAGWLLDREMETIEAAAAQYPDYNITLVGHSLGSGVVAMMMVVMLKTIEETSLTRERLRCYCIAPARSTSLNLAVRYADTINSVTLQVWHCHALISPLSPVLHWQYVGGNPEVSNHALNGCG